MARISVNCPRCQTTYQVDADLTGKRMRCPNVLCQHIFEVGAAAPPPPTSEERSLPALDDLPKKSTSGTVGDIVPILQAEIAAPAPPEPPPQRTREAPKKIDAPPIRRRSKPAEPMVHRPQAAPADEIADVFKDLISDESVADAAPPAQALTEKEDWKAPPVRRRGETSIQAEPVATTFREPVPSVRKVRRRSRWIITTLALLLLAGIGAAAWVVLNRQADVEMELAARAETVSQKSDFAGAASLYQQLLREYPSSKHRAEYQFNTELNSVLEAVHASQSDPDETIKALDRLGQFIRFQQGGPLFAKHQEELARAARGLAQRLIDHAEQNKDSALLAAANGAWQTSVGLREPGHIDSAKDREQITDRLSKMKELFAAQERRERVIGQIKELLPTARSVQAARELVEREKLTADAEISKLLNDLVQRHVSSITYTPTNDRPPPVQVLEDSAPTVAFAPAVPIPATQLAANKELDGKHTVLALARGVLYAVEANSGKVRWLRRIGADAVRVPLRIPATPISHEMAVFIGGDQNLVCAIDLEDGADVWRHRLESPCVAEPLLFEHRLLAPTLSGRIEELDCFTGRLHGHYGLGQRLTTSGVHQPDTDFVYFPADDLCVYILDVVKQTCVGVLYTGHAAGSVRTSPVILDPYGDAKDVNKGLLALSEADGIDATRMRLFALPITDSNQPAVVDQRHVGAIWQPPWQDGETVAQISNTGNFVLQGIRQPGNNDPLVFPIAQHEFSAGKAAQEGRALLAHADAENYWVLARGRLQRLQRRFLMKTGPALVERWPESVPLGNPLHRADVLQQSDGHPTLILATQPENSADVLLSAVETNAGRIHWQRRLGLVFEGDPIVAGKKVLLLESDGVSIIDATIADSKAPFVVAELGKQLTLPRNGDRRLVTTPMRDVGIIQRSGKALKVDIIDKDGTNHPSNTLKLSGEMAGVAALANDCVVAPLANGILERLLLTGDERSLGPNWRSSLADADSRALTLAVGKDEFIVSDGDCGLRLIHWPDAKTWEKKAEKVFPTAVVAVINFPPPPAPLPGVPGRGESALAVEASGVVSLLEAGTLRVVRNWQMPGRITSGPFARGGAIGCVVEGNRLVWVDASKDGVAWEYAFDADIVGQPAVVNDLVIVATVAGQFQALDVKTVQLRGNGYLLRANVAPAAAPVAIANGNLLAPLTDGTAILLPLADIIAE